MTTSKPISILFDAAHNEEVILQEPELSSLCLLLETNGMKTGSLDTSITLEELTNFKVIVLGNPRESKLKSKEIKALQSFVESGGGLLLISGATIFGKGGDSARLTNLNALATKFHFEFSEKAISRQLEGDLSDAAAKDEMIMAVPAAQHPLVKGISHLLFTTSTSIKAEDTATHLFRTANSPGNPTNVITIELDKGRVLAMGGATPFFNDYVGIHDHEVFIIQAFRWLAGHPVNVPVISLTPDTEMSEVVSANEAIADLQLQLNQIEQELAGLKKVINTSLKEMEKIIRQFQDEKDES
ncbi:MAG: hypothetical protein Q6364_13080 [Candidatus Hermodarchaeota archaeon]|nr:hypothetical protein [Candidatus Hermodarchaeota archaeon]